MREMMEGEPPYADVPQLKVYTSYKYTFLLMQIQALFLITTQGLPPLANTDEWSEDCLDFLDCCMQKDPEMRADANSLLKVMHSAKSPFERHNT